MPKIIMFRGGVETLTYFSEQIAQYFTQKGWQVFWYDIAASDACAKHLRRFIKRGETVVLTFNFLGLTQEAGVFDEDGGYVWEQYEVPCYNIVVDHPLYYKDRLEQNLVSHKGRNGRALYYQISIDREHERYMKEYYEEVATLGFCPLAGSRYEGETNTRCADTCSDWLKARPIDVLFVGSVANPQEYARYMERINDEYTAFYRGIASELLHHPRRSLTEVAKRHCVREMGNLTQEEWRICFQHLNFMDLYLRFYERLEVLKALVSHGVVVDVYGHGYEELSIADADCLRVHGAADSAQCLQAMQQAKIALNVMPWFREGAHDRIFNAMANGSVCVTDSSRYIDEILTDGEDIVLYDLLDLPQMVDTVKHLLAQPEQMWRIQNNAQKTVEEKHLWKHRAAWLEEQMRAREQFA